jgi:hypothetical protein
MSGRPWPDAVRVAKEDSLMEKNEKERKLERKRK